MRKSLLTSLLLMFCSIALFAQPANDPCSAAVAITALDGTCTMYNNNMATFDLANGDCAPSTNAPNVWFSFVSQGPDVDIAVDGLANDVYVTLLRFNPTPCDFASAGQVDCGVATAFNDAINFTGLVVGNTYYIIINLADGGGTVAEGNFQICVDNPIPLPGPPNDDACAAQVVNVTGITCVNGSTVAADDDMYSFPGCSVNDENGVFYEFVAGDLGIVIDVNSLSLGGDVAVVLGSWSAGCGSTFLIEDLFCGAPGGSLIDFSGLTIGNDYVIYIGTSEIDEGDFELCLMEFGPPPGCSVNNDCNSAESIAGIVSGSPPVCVTGCNILASPYPSNPPFTCGIQDQETVWYTFTSDANGSLLSINLTSSDILAPVLQVVTTTCSGTYTPVGNCVTGSAGIASITNLIIMPNTTYHILVSNDFGDGGFFELCVSTFEDISACVVSSTLDVQPGSPSLGSPDNGPYLPGESVTFCYELSDYQADPVGSGNNCQWLQGIVPVFGDGWNLAVFDPNASTPPTLYGGTWSWYAAGITYKTNNTNISIGDFDADGSVDVCHITEPGCANTGTTIGQVMPPGWFAAQNNGNPNSQYGDGNCCSCTMGPWNFCFTLTANDYATCSIDDETDLSVKIYTFADGETGLWGAQNPNLVSVCGQDIPNLNTASLNCCQGPMLAPADAVFCPGDQVSIQLSTIPNNPNASFEWVVIDNPNTDGESDGSGDFITDVITNNGGGIQFVTYMVRAIDPQGCPSEPQPVVVTILPSIEVDAGSPIDGCAQGQFPLGGSPTATGGDGSFTYNWSNSLGTAANPVASPNITTTYVVTVTDGNGCTSTDDVLLTINPRFDVEIDGDTLLCPDFPVTTISGAPLGGTPNYSFQWFGQGTNNSTNQILDWDGFGLPSGNYTITLEVTDNNGCTGDTEFVVDVFNDPQLFISSIPQGGQFCPGETIDISAAAILGEPGVVYSYNWTTPSGQTLNGTNIVADETGYYVLEIFDPIINCIKTDSIFIEEIAAPEPEIEAPAGVCSGDMVYISTLEEYDSYIWNNGSVEDSILVVPGTYFVTVTNSAGCSGEDAITVNPFPPVSAAIGGSSAFCEGSSSILNVGSNFATYEWTNGAGQIISTADTAVVQTAGTVSVIVYDNNGCSTSASVDVQIQDFLVPNVQGDTSICPQACTDLNAGSGYSSYLWSNGDTVQVITVCDAGSYSVTVSDLGGCTGEQVKVITVNNLPTATITGEGGKTSICPGDDIMLDAGAGYIAYQWDDNSNGQTLEVDEAGVYVVTVTDSEGCQGTAELEILLDDIPEPSFTGDQQFCPGDSVLITPEAGFNLYEIDLDNNGSVDLTNMSNDPFYVNVVGNSNIIVTDQNGCEGEVLVNVSQFTPPSPETTTDTASFCTSSSVFISLETDFDVVSWLYNGNEVGSQQTIEVAQAGIYDVIVSDLNGCSGNTSIVVIESTELFPSITGDNQMCDFTPIQLDAGQGYDTYDWGPLGDQQVVTVTSDGVYTVTVYDAGGCSGSTEIIVTNSNTPTATLEEFYLVCNNMNGDNESTVSFNSLVSGANGFWEDTDGTGVSLTNLNNVDFEGVTAGTYTFTYETSIAIAPCDDQAYTMQIEVSECLCPSLELGTVEPVCQGDASFELDDYKVTNESGFWNVEDGTGAVLDAGVFDPANAIPGTYILSFNLEAPQENCDSMQTLQIEVIAPPNPGISAAPMIVCLNENEQVPLSDLLTGEDSNGTWTEVSTNPSPIGAFDGVGTFETGTVSTGTYVFRYDVAGNTPCADAFSEVQVIIEPLPIAVAGDDKMLDCDLLEVQIGTNNSSGNNLSYSWTESKGISIENDNDPIIEVDEEGTYMLEVIDQNLCSDLDSVIVTRNTNFPDLTLVGEDPFCQGENTGVVLASGFGGQGPYEYSLDNGNTWVEADAFLDLSAGTYTVLVQDQNSCTGEEVVTIEDPAAFVVGLGGNLQLQNVEDTLISLDVSTGISNLQAAIWTVNGSIVCEGPDCLAYQVELDSNKEVCVYATSTDGCIDSTCINIRVVKVNNSYTGNSFTPDDDGVNDVFYIQGGADILEVNYFRIYDRWGEQVFNVENFPPNDPEFGWNGRFKDGSVAQGVYVYLAEVVFENGDVEFIQGDLTVYR